MGHAPCYLLRDRDQIFGKDFVDQVKAMGIKQVLSAPRAPWQRAYVERLIGSIRRECMDHFIVLGERSLHRTLTAYCAYYHRWRTHLSLGKDAPQSRRIPPPAEGAVVEIAEVGGLHHHYERRAAQQASDETPTPHRVPAEDPQASRGSAPPPRSM